MKLMQKNFFFKGPVNVGQASDLYRILNSKMRHSLPGSNLSLSTACFAVKLIPGIEHGQIPVDLNTFIS